MIQDIKGLKILRIEINNSKIWEQMINFSQMEIHHFQIKLGESLANRNI